MKVSFQCWLVMWRYRVMNIRSDMMISQVFFQFISFRMEHVVDMIDVKIVRIYHRLSKLIIQTGSINGCQFSFMFVDAVECRKFNSQESGL